MAFSMHVFQTQGLAVARCDGLVLESEIHAAIDFSFEVWHMQPGTDRLVLVEPTADLGGIDAEALHRIHEHVFDLSGQHAAPAFRSVLVTPSPFHRPVAELYKAIWDSHRLPAVDFWVVTTPEEAARLLGFPKGFALLGRLPPGAPWPER
jgi:hypothetical protein